MPRSAGKPPPTESPSSSSVPSSTRSGRRAPDARRPMSKPLTAPQLHVVRAERRDARPESVATTGRVDLDELYRRYAPYVAVIATRILGRDDELDDLVQDVFLGAL